MTAKPPLPTCRLPFPLSSLSDLVAQVLGEALAQFRVQQAALDSQRIAYTESEAARLLSIEIEQLQEENRQGRIRTCTIAGCVRYSRAELERYVADGRVLKKG